MKTYKSIDEYIASFPKETQEKLTEIRNIIKSQAPESIEKFGYDMPAFYLNGRYLVYYAAWKNHIGFYPIPTAIAKFKDEISKHKHSKGSIQFPLDQQLPIELIKKIVKFRIEENSNKKAK